MKKHLLIFAAMFLYACHFNEPTITYSQFTKDDLSYLYYNKDTLINVGQDIEYMDTITYLLNDTDSIHVKIETKIYSYFSNPWIQTTKEISGSSSISFNKSSGFMFANITISKWYDVGYPVRFFEVGIYGTWGFSKQYMYNDTIPTDTALVLGKIYQNVLKFYPPEEDKSDIRLIYFAKKYGYIKIVKTDGSKLERMDEGK
jgi:hypothetical protein